MTATATPTGVGIELTPEQEKLQQRARRFTEEVLIPLEELSERNGGRLPAAEIEEIRAAAIEARLNGGRHSPTLSPQFSPLVVDWLLAHPKP